MRWFKSGSRTSRRSYSCSMPSAAAGSCPPAMVEKSMDTFRGLIGNRAGRAWMLGTLAVLATLSWLWLPDRRTDAAPRSHDGQVVAVDTSEVKRADVPVYLDGLGTIQAFNTVTVTARVDGELQKIVFEEGK